MQTTEKVRILHDDVTARIADEVVEGNRGDEIEVTEAMSIFLGLKRWCEPL